VITTLGKDPNQDILKIKDITEFDTLTRLFTSQVRRWITVFQRCVEAELDRIYRSVQPHGLLDGADALVSPVVQDEYRGRI